MMGDDEKIKKKYFDNAFFIVRDISKINFCKGMAKLRGKKIGAL